MPVSQGRGIFVSYRREDSSHLAGRLYDRLADRFGEGQVFIDVDAIEPGVDFAEEVNRAVEACMVLVAVIGLNWLTATNERGHRRLDDPDDFVRLEIETALARGVRVIPVLADGAVAPRWQDLPQSLAGLARRNAFMIRHESFRSDTGRLVTVIEQVVPPPVPSRPGPPQISASDLLVVLGVERALDHLELLALAGPNGLTAEMLLASSVRISSGLAEMTRTGPPGSSPKPNASPSPSPSSPGGHRR
jgi:hypothetical protein